MMKKTGTCDAHIIESFLSDRLLPEQKQQFSDHLETCPSCQQALAMEAAEPEFWDEAAGFLGNAISETTIHSGANENPDEPIPQISIRSILDWLSPTDDPEMLGRIGEYEISAVVGIGGMGAVLKGFDKSLLRVVAIKVMAPHLANHGSARCRFEREARAAAAISHDNVIDIYRVAEKDGLPYLIMPFARGPSLQKRIDQDGPLTSLEVVQVGRQIAAGLAAAHEQGLVHRDIKPANILLNDGIERILITDFGVARAMDDASMTQTGLIAGTPQFMSPEQARGELVDHRSDLFSLGAVLYTACTGRPPFRSDAPFAVLRKITDTEPRPIREINPEIHGWLENMIHCLLDKNPTDRFDDAKHVAELFEKCLAHLRQPSQTALPPSVIHLQPRTVPKTAKLDTNSNSKIKKLGFIMSSLALIAIAIAGIFHIMDAPDISGTWRGESWSNIQLATVEEAKDWYAGKFVNADGKQGALHLEWSPTRGRFDGRWSIGTQNSGTIVLRSGKGGSVRGAILMDSKVGTNTNEVRLRDFVWSPSEVIVQNERLTEPRDNDDRQHAVASPTKGIVKRVSPEIGNGSRVKKGDLIIEIENAGANPFEYERNLFEVQKESARNKANAYSANIEGYQQARDYSVNSATQLANAARSKYESKLSSIPALESHIQKAQLDYERQKKLYEKSLVSAQEIQTSETELQTAVANLHAAKMDAEALKSEWKAKQIEIEEKSRLAQTKIDHAKAMQQDAERQIAKASKKLEELEAKSAKFERLIIYAPRDGVVAAWRGLNTGEFVKEGETILRLIPIDQATAINPPAIKPPVETSLPSLNESPNALEFSSIPAVLDLATDLETRLRNASDSLQTAASEIASTRAKIVAETNTLEALKKQSDGSESESVISDKIKRARSSVAVYEQQLANLEASHKNDLETLKAANNKLDTMMNLLKLELESAKSQVAAANKMVELQRTQYQQGVISVSEMQPNQTKLQKLETKVRQLEQLLAHFLNIKRSDTSPEKSRR